MSATSAAVLNPIEVIDGFSLEDPLIATIDVKGPSPFHTNFHGGNSRAFSVESNHGDAISEALELRLAVAATNTKGPQRVEIEKVLEANKAVMDELITEETNYRHRKSVIPSATSEGESQTLGEEPVDEEIGDTLNSEDDSQLSKTLDTDGIDNTTAFAVVGLLSPAEAEYIIATAVPHTVPLDALYAQRTRKADRAMIRSPLVADQLYKRIMPHLKKTDYADRTPLCFGHDGVWMPYGLNECLKVFRYNEGGLFVEHRDGPWVPRQDQCSMFTVVVYLNDDFVGGHTRLLGSCASCSPKGMRESDEDSNLTIVPRTGMAVLFNHDCWHGGSGVEEGTKWILRTELIFQRVHKFYVDRDAFASSEEYTATRALYDASMKASQDGDRELFFNSYQEVVRRQREAMLREEAARKPRLLATVGLEELSLVMSYLGGREIKKLLSLNRRTYMAVAQAPYWQDLWEGGVRLIGESVPAMLRGQGSRVITSLLRFKKDLGDSRQISDSQPTSSHHDYFGLVRQRLWLRQELVPTGLILMSGGSLMTIPSNSSIRTARHLYARDSRPCFFEVMEIAETRSFKLYKSEKYYGGWLFAYPYHMNQPFGESLTMSDSPRGLETPKSVVDGVTGKVEWSVLTVPIEELIMTNDSPIVIVTPPTWFGPNGPLPHAQDALNALFGLSRVPAIGFCHPASCAVIGYLSSFCTADPSLLKSHLSIELRYETSSYLFMVSTADFSAEVLQVGSCSPDIVLVDNVVRSKTSRLTEGADLAKAQAAAAEGQAVHGLSEVLAHGVEVVIASPAIRDGLIYRY